LNFFIHKNSSYHKIEMGFLGTKCSLTESKMSPSEGKKTACGNQQMQEQREQNRAAREQTLSIENVKVFF